MLAGIPILHKGDRMGSHRTEHDRENCIGCGACAAVCPKYWTMAADGKSTLIGASKRDSDGWEVLDFPDEDYASMKQSADVCPVNVIHIVKKDTGEKII